MTKETLQKDLEKALKKAGLYFTRLRTPSYGYRGVRYPGDYVLWGKDRTSLIECKQRKSLPLAPSDIRQMKFMEDWKGLPYVPKAFYGILVGTEEGYFVFSHSQAVRAKEIRKGLRASDALFSAQDLNEIALRLGGIEW